MTVLVSGGAKNGKSDFAQELAVKLADGGPHYYVATMIPCDAEDYARIARHLASREGLGFETIECGRDIQSCTAGREPHGAYLLDSATALLMNELFPPETGYQPDPDAPSRCIRGLEGFLKAVDHAVIVSDAIYGDAAEFDETTELYRRGLAAIDCTLARMCDVVIEVSANHLIFHKGQLPW